MARPRTFSEFMAAIRALEVGDGDSNDTVIGIGGIQLPNRWLIAEFPELGADGTNPFVEYYVERQGDTIRRQWINAGNLLLLTVAILLAGSILWVALPGFFANPLVFLVVVLAALAGAISTVVLSKAENGRLGDSPAALFQPPTLQHAFDIALTPLTGRDLFLASLAISFPTAQGAGRFRGRLRLAGALAGGLLLGLAVAELWTAAAVGALLVALAWYVKPAFQSSIEVISPDLITRAPMGIREMRLLARLAKHPRGKQLRRAWHARRRAESRAILATQLFWLLPIIATFLTIVALIAGAAGTWLAVVLAGLLAFVAQSDIAHARQQVARWKCRRQADAIIQGFEHQRECLRAAITDSAGPKISS